MDTAVIVRPPASDEARQLQATPGPVAKSNRLEYLDALKVFLIALVIAHHAGQAFGPTGGAWPIYNDERAPILDAFFTVNAAFFMGLFFFISAYFVPGSFDHKGPTTYLKDRFVRLGVPLLAALLLNLAYGLVQYAFLGGDPPWVAVVSVVTPGHFGWLWFLDLLLVFTAVYVAWRLLTARRSVEALPLPNTAAILVFTLVVSLVMFVVRIGYPVNRWDTLLGFITAEPAHLPQYASMFLAGLLAYRGRWLHTMPTRTGLSWLAFAIALTGLPYLTPFVGLNGGGLNLSALERSVWESLVCVSLSIGLMVLFREYVAAPGRLLRMAAPNAYGAYILHVIVVVPLQAAVIPLAAAPLLKFALVTVFAVPISFGLTALVRRVRAVRSVI